MSGSEPRVSAEMLRSTSTPNTVESRLGTLKFTDGAPTKATAELLYDHRSNRGGYNTGADRTSAPG